MILYVAVEILLINYMKIVLRLKRMSLSLIGEVINVILLNLHILINSTLSINCLRFKILYLAAYVPVRY